MFIARLDIECHFLVKNKVLTLLAMPFTDMLDVQVDIEMEPLEQHHSQCRSTKKDISISISETGADNPSLVSVSGSAMSGLPTFESSLHIVMVRKSSIYSKNTVSHIVQRDIA